MGMMVASNSPVTVFHNLTVASQLVVANKGRVGLKAIDVILSVCAFFMVNTGSPFALPITRSLNKAYAVRCAFFPYATAEMSPPKSLVRMIFSYFKSNQIRE